MEAMKTTVLVMLTIDFELWAPLRVQRIKFGLLFAHAPQGRTFLKRVSCFLLASGRILLGAAK